MNSNEIEKFIKKNALNFRINGTGWNALIEKMLFEFCISGWDMNNDVGGKEKFGGLRCYISIEDKILEKKITDIISKYVSLSGKTCEYCGGCGKPRIDKKTQREQTLCKKCYLEEKLKSKKKGIFQSKKKLTLSECKICGYFAVAENRCNFCNKVSYLPGVIVYKPKEYYGTEEEYIKECQIEIFLDLDDEIELNKHRNYYTKSETHQIIFSNEDLKQYMDSLEE